MHIFSKRLNMVISVDMPNWYTVFYYKTGNGKLNLLGDKTHLITPILLQPTSSLMVRYRKVNCKKFNDSLLWKWHLKAIKKETVIHLKYVPW